jgi:hypothetical protein
MAEEKTAKQGAIAVPPYISFKTFDSFIRSLKVGIPTRIDRSVLSSMSGGVQAQLMSALRFLGLVTPHSVTTEKLSAFVNSEGPERERVLSGLLKESYPFLFQDFDLQRATTGQLEEAFRKVGASGDTIRKCVAFFLSAAKGAAIAVSPHIKVSGISRGPNRPRKAASPATPGTEEEEEKPGETPLSPPLMTSWNQMLLAKFPSFDPAWPNDVKAKWFESFERLMKAGDAKV